MTVSIDDYNPSEDSNLHKDVKKAWLKALRGNRRQGAYGLKVKLKDGGIGYCCLGVLCDLGEHRKRKWKWDEYNLATYDGKGGIPPNYVLKRSGLDSHDARILANMNDCGFGFKEIASWIEKHL